jgi:flagellar hook-associated protein 1 FlgK
MASLSTAWNITTSALTADQAALATIASNTANAATPGYTQEAAIWQQAPPLEIDGQTLSDGVVDDGAVSQRDRVLNRSIDLQTQTQAGTAARLGGLQNLEYVFSSATGVSSTATGGIGDSMSGFFGSLQQLESLPSNPSLRESVLAAANELAQSFNSAASNLNQQQQTLNGDVQSVVTQANGLLQSLATLNAQIQSADPNQDAGVLEDQRQLDLGSLSLLLGTQQTATERNGLTLTTVSGSPLVEGNKAVSLSTADIGGVEHIFSGTTDITSAVVAGGGQAGGLIQVAQTDIPSALSSLDTLAYELGSEINAVNEAGSDQNGNPGIAIFTLPATAAGSAANISVAITNPALIAAAALGAGPSDGSNATVMAALASSATIAGATPSNYLASLVSSLGSTTAEVSSANTGQQASLAQLTNQQTALSGVSLDSEATALENMEQAYEAASKVFAVVSAIMADAMNLGTPETAV